MESGRQQHRTSGWPPSRREWIGFAAAIVIATILVVLVGWLQVLG